MERDSKLNLEVLNWNNMKSLYVVRAIKFRVYVHECIQVRPSMIDGEDARNVEFRVYEVCNVRKILNCLATKYHLAEDSLYLEMNGEELMPHQKLYDVFAPFIDNLPMLDCKKYVT